MCVPTHHRLQNGIIEKICTDPVAEEVGVAWWRGVAMGGAYVILDVAQVILDRPTRKG